MKLIKFIDFKAEIASRGKEYNLAINRVLKSGWFILGPEVTKFEKQFTKYLGVKYCIGVGNGLEALQISLMSQGIGPGDEVITTPVSAVASTLAIMAVGAKPIFVDTDRLGLLKVDLVSGAITAKTKAILPVHLYGNPVNLDALQKICKKNNLFLIEDACQAHGSSFRGKKLGTFGAANCFSFYPTKNLGAFGDGGAIVTDFQKVADLCRQIRDYGQSDKYIHSVYGLNSRLDEIHAAILQVKLKYLDSDNQKRRQLAQKYINNLSKASEIEIISPKNIDGANYHIFAIRTPKRNSLQKYLSNENIQSLVHYPLTITDQPFLKSRFKSLNIPNARSFADETLSLPIHPWLTDENIDYISEKITNFFKGRATS